MGSTWDHPELGRFEHDTADWIGTVAVPAFTAFTYDAGNRDAGLSDGAYELAFESEDEEDVPSPEAAALVTKVVANQADLVSKVTGALWDDFNGRGPRSGMWWHGQLDEVAESLEIDGSPTGPDDLFQVMQLARVTVRRHIYRHDGPLVELTFHATFEEEHDVGILTDGENILGTGYGSDVSPFESER